MIYRKMSLLLLVISVVTTVFGATLKKRPYLLFEGDNTSMTIMWQMDASPVADFTIKWGLDPSCNGGTGNCGRDEYTEDFLYKYKISGLTPGTKYFYEVIGDVTGTGSFRTAPKDEEESVILWGYGDSQNEAEIATKIQENIIREYRKNPEQQTICLRLGDWTNSSPILQGEETEANWRDFHFKNHEEFLSEMPMVGPKGNHEMSGILFKKYYPFPYIEDIRELKNGSFYWSFDYGPVHFVVLDVSEDDATEFNYKDFLGYNKRPVSYSNQTEWLDEDLSETDKFWKIVLVYSPGWSAQVGHHKNNDYIQKKLNPIFQDHGVTWVLSGHIHYFAHAQAPGDRGIRAVNYITSGGGGSNLVNIRNGGETPFEYKVEDPIYNGNPKSVYHYFKIHIKKEPALGYLFNFYVYDVNGNMFYSYTEEASFAEQFTIISPKMISDKYSSKLKTEKYIIPSFITEMNCVNSDESILNLPGLKMILQKQY